MQDPFRPNSNAQLMREAQIGFIVIGLLLCVLVYVAFYRLTNRSSRFDQMARNVPVAQSINSDPYEAHSVVQIEEKRKERLAEEKRGAFASNEEFSSMVKASGLQPKSSNEKVAQANHTSSLFPSYGSTKRPASTAPPAPKSVDKGFAPVTKSTPKVPRSFISQPSRTDFDIAKEKTPLKQPKVKPPVIASKFGSKPRQDFLPAPIPKKAETKTDSTGFEAFLAKPLKTELPKPKPPIPDSIDKAVIRHLPGPDAKDQSSDFVPRTSTSQKHIYSDEVDFGQLDESDESPTIAQTSAFEPVKAAPVLPVKMKTASVPRPEPSKKRVSTFVEVGKTYKTQKGDSLWTIAQAVYGDGRYFRALHEMNQDTLSLSDSIPTGTVLKVSSIKELRNDYPELCPNQEKNHRSPNGPVAGDSNQKLGAPLDDRFYRTEDGDTLFEIARQRLGQASRYLEIYELNRFRIPETANHLTPLGGGIELLLPQ